MSFLFLIIGGCLSSDQPKVSSIVWCDVSSAASCATFKKEFDQQADYYRSACPKLFSEVVGDYTFVTSNLDSTLANVHGYYVDFQIMTPIEKLDLSKFTSKVFLAVYLSSIDLYTSERLLEKEDQRGSFERKLLEVRKLLKTSNRSRIEIGNELGKIWRANLKEEASETKTLAVTCSGGTSTSVEGFAVVQDIKITSDSKCKVGNFALARPLSDPPALEIDTVSTREGIYYDPNKKKSGYFGNANADLFLEGVLLKSGSSYGVSFSEGYIQAVAGGVIVPETHIYSEWQSGTATMYFTYDIEEDSGRTTQESEFEIKLTIADGVDATKIQGSFGIGIMEYTEAYYTVAPRTRVNGWFNIALQKCFTDMKLLASESTPKVTITFDGDKWKNVPKDALTLTFVSSSENDIIIPDPPENIKIEKTTPASQSASGSGNDGSGGN